MTKLISFLLTIFTLVLATKDTLVQAVISDPPANQNDTNLKYFWGQVGILMAGRFGYQLGTNYNQDKHILSARYYQNKEEFAGFPFSEPKLNTIQWINNFSLLYGQSFSNNYFKFIRWLDYLLDKEIGEIAMLTQ